MTDQQLATIPTTAMTSSEAGPVDARVMVRAATTMANELASIIKQQGLAVRISGREYVRFEGWTTLATMNGYLPWEVSNERQDDGSYVATVELRRMSDGKALVRAVHECGGEDEKMWHDRPRYARRSMAVTRATGKACRMAFSWIMVLAGYHPTPFEEMPAENGHHEPVEERKPHEALPPKTGRIDTSDANLLKAEISSTAKQLKLPVRESAERVLQYARTTHGVE